MLKCSVCKVENETVSLHGSTHMHPMSDTYCTTCSKNFAESFEYIMDLLTCPVAKRQGIKMIDNIDPRFTVYLKGHYIPLSVVTDMHEKYMS